MRRNQILNELAQCTGSEGLFYNRLFKDVKYTDGIKLMVEICGSYWFLTDVLANCVALQKEHEFISVKLHKEENEDKCFIAYDDGNDNIILSIDYSFTDFPLYNYTKDERKRSAMHLYCTNGVLHLPSEY
jgi:hypothetical protein